MIVLCCTVTILPFTFFTRIAIKHEIMIIKKYIIIYYTIPFIIILNFFIMSCIYAVELSNVISIHKYGW